MKEKSTSLIFIPLMFLVSILIIYKSQNLNIETEHCKEESAVLSSNQITADTESKDIINKSLEVIENQKNQIDIATKEMNKKMAEIDSIQDKKEWFITYKSIVEKYEYLFDPPETIYNYYSSEELNLLFRVVQAEIGNYSFEQKCNVVSVIFNRINHEKFPDTMSEILVPSQFSTISNGSIYRVTVDEETILACEYVFMFGDTTDGALFFDSNGALGYKYLFNDGAHNFYTTYK